MSGHLGNDLSRMVGPVVGPSATRTRVVMLSTSQITHHRVIALSLGPLFPAAESGIILDD